MAWLIAGLVLFLGSHSVQIFAPALRARLIAQWGEARWKGLYALTAFAGLALIGHGYATVHLAAPLYPLPPQWRHLAFLLIWLGFVGVVAAYWPGNHIKQAVRDPMVAGVGAWALGHLTVNATPAALILFGSFLAWAIADFISLRQRGPAKPAPAPTVMNTALVLLIGTALAAVFALWLHLRLIGVSPLSGAM